MKDKLTKKKIIIIIVAAVAVLCVGVGVYAATKWSKVKTTGLDEKKLDISEEMQGDNKNYINVALFGIDAHGKDEKKAQSDAIVVASLNKETKEVKLISVYGNTVLSDEKGKAVAAKNIYKSGAEEAVAALNRNLDLDIQHYMTVDFQAMIELIDYVGGIEIDVKEEEIPHITGYTADLITVTGKDSMGITAAGPQMLNGTQATAYTRIRATDGADVARNSRQQEVLTKLMQKLLALNITQIDEAINITFPKLETNFKLSELIDYGKDAAVYKLGSMTGFPFTIAEGAYEGIEEGIKAGDYKGDVLKLHQQLFPDLSYEPTKNVDQTAKLF